MAAYIHKNALEQAIDVAGSLLQQDARTLQDEPDGIGRSVSGSTTTTASFGTPDGNGIQLISGPTLQFYIDSPGRYVRIAGAFSGSNNGVFLITSATLPSSASILNAAGQPESGNTASFDERYDYSLEDDLNFERTDRRHIKGTTNFYDGIPTYIRPTATNVNVTASLQNIASKTTDAMALVTTRLFLTGTINSGSFYTTLTGTGIFPFADTIDHTGVPVDDGFDAGNTEATYVEIIDPNEETAFTVLSGANAGQRIYGVTFGGSGSEPDIIGVKFMRVAVGSSVSTGVPYSWEAGLPLTATFAYGFRQRLDQLDESALRRTMVNGLVGDSDLQLEVQNVRKVLDFGVSEDATSLAGLLTNTGANFAFFNLPDATPSVVEALNTLNAQIGDRTYTGPYLTSGQTIAASLQALSNAISNISATSIRRIIERVSSDINVGANHTIPGGYTYTPTKASGSGMMFVFWRGVLRDPGSITGSDDYNEVSTTQISPYSKIKSGDHISYFISY